MAVLSIVQPYFNNISAGISRLIATLRYQNKSKRQGKELWELMLTRLSYLLCVNNTFLFFCRWHLACADEQWLALFQCHFERYFSLLFESSGVLPRLLANVPTGQRVFNCAWFDHSFTVQVLQSVKLIGTRPTAICVNKKKNKPKNKRENKKQEKPLKVKSSFFLFFFTSVWP